jgi:hypothetical protein
LPIGTAPLCAPLPLLGEFEPLLRQFFVSPFAFLVPAVGNDRQAVWRFGGEFFALRA